MEWKVPNTTKGYAELEMKEGIAVIRWEPGNSTRYLLMVVPMLPAIISASGFAVQGEACLVTWLRPGQACYSYVFSNLGILSYKYVQEKLCEKVGNHVDASELTRIIGLLLQRETILCTDKDGRQQVV